MNLEETKSCESEIFCSSILFWLIILEVCQCLENNMQMPLVSDQLYLPALSHINMICFCSVIYKSGISCITVTLYCISTQRRIALRAFSLHVENGRRTAEMVNQGATFCKTTAVTLLPSLGSKHRECKPSLASASN